jgi:predicted MPP superfamily phosphohydrolase
VLDNILEKFNVHIIDDEKVNIHINDIDLNIVGLKDIWDSPVDNSLLSDFSKEDNVIVIAHNPDTSYEIENDEVVDLVISGHTHGGQVRLPFVYKYAIPTYYDFDKGLYEVGDMNVYITSGTGMVGLPLRFLIPPEVVILEIRL